MSAVLLVLLAGCRDKTEPAPEDAASIDTGTPVPLCLDGAPVQDFVAAEASEALYATAADFTVETLDGTWTLSEQWDGCSSYLIIQEEPRQATGWPTPLWDRDHDDLLALLPASTHVLFVSSQGGDDDRIAALEALQEAIEEVLTDDFSAAEQEDIRSRIHYLTERDTSLDGWLGDMMQDPGWGVGIDRFQRIRYIGSYADPYRYSSSYGWFEPNLGMAANEAIAYDFEALRQAALEADGADVVTVFDEDYCAGNVYTDITLPDAEAMAAYDTLSIDLYMGCEGDGEYGYCPAWDYMAYLYLCDMPEADNPFADTPCQPSVEEVAGTCYADGKATEATCSAAEDCEDGSAVAWTCEGYTAAVAADTQTGTCLDPLGEPTEATYTCLDDGTGYDEIACACDTEIGRWITTYHREGRWVYDNSAVLPYLARGGERTFRFNTTGPYVLDLDLRLSSQGKDARPEEVHYLFSGGTLNSSYNSSHEPVTLDIPADAVKVELATVITQHGFDSNNCGEFCDVAHHFSVNGDEASEIVLSFPEAGSAYDCMDKVAEGTIPNQYGTWWYGRAGWCPGKDAPTTVTDITDQVVLGAENTFGYEALYQGAEYTGSATIRMNAWLVISR